MEDTGRKLKNGPQKWHVDVESGDENPQIADAMRA